VFGCMVWGVCMGGGGGGGGGGGWLTVRQNPFNTHTLNVSLRFFGDKHCSEL